MVAIPNLGPNERFSMYNPFDKTANASESTLKRKRLESINEEEDNHVDRAKPSNGTTSYIQNIFGVRVADDSVLCLVDFFGRCVTNPYTEVEFKLGLVLEKAENRRVYLPIAAETPLSPEFNDKVRFQSQVDLVSRQCLMRSLAESAHSDN